MGTTTIDHHSDRPKYKQLADLLRAEILAGRLAGDMAPERELADLYGISLTTVRQAMQLLKTEGLIISGRGFRNRVRPGRVVAQQRYSKAKRSYEEESAFAREHGVPWAEFDVEREISIEAAPLRIANLLGLEPGADVYTRRYVHSLDGVLLRLSTSYLRVTDFADTAMVDPTSELVPGGTIAQLHTLGHDVHRVHTDCQARDATPFEADMLNIAAPQYVLEACRAMYVFNATRAVEAAVHVYPPRRGYFLSFDTFVNDVEPPGVSYD